jgi:NADPH:quinone reductase-like Zn-dependent oxidoreductase
MKAIVLEEFGAPRVLRYVDVPAPQAGPGEIVINVHSVSVNRTLDCILRAGKYPAKIQLPHVPGADPAGEVAEVGDRVAVVSAVPCQTCMHCRNGNASRCANGKRVGVDVWAATRSMLPFPSAMRLNYPIA